jgi:hypothetical protein
VKKKTIKETAHHLIDLIDLIPGYTPEKGVLRISIGQHCGGARWVDVVWEIKEQQELNGGVLAGLRVRKLAKKDIDNILIAEL